MDKDNERKRPKNKNEKETAFDPNYDRIVPPKTNSSLGEIDNRFDRNELDESGVIPKPKEKTQGNEVEASLNPDDDSDIFDEDKDNQKNK